MSVEVFDPEMAYRCAAADTKPLNPSHDLLYEWDTYLWYCWNGTAWVLYHGPGPATPEAINLTAQGLIAQNFDRQIPAGTGLMLDGRVYFMLVPLRSGQVVTSLSISVTTQGSGLTLSKVGLYTKAGVRLGLSADQVLAWETTGQKTIALITPVTIATTDGYYVAVVAKATTTLPTLLKGSGFSTGSAAIGSGAGPYGVQAGQTDLPSPATISVGAASSAAYWVGLS